MGTEKASKAHAVELFLCPLCPVVIQFHAVALAVCAQGEPKQRIAGSTAGVEQVDGDAGWE